MSIDCVVSLLWFFHTFSLSAPLFFFSQQCAKKTRTELMIINGLKGKKRTRYVHMYDEQIARKTKENIDRRTTEEL